MAYILIIDDDEDLAFASATVLRDDGHEVHIELDTVSGEKSMHERCPDLLLLDIMFPENPSGGFELARKMKRICDDLNNIPILMISAINNELPMGFSSKDIDNNWLPVDDFLEKPVDLDIMKSKVSSLLSTHVKKNCAE